MDKDSTNVTGTHIGSICPIPVLRRLSHYLYYLRTQLDPEQDWISSLELAHAIEATSSTVRQDLSCIDIKGRARRGYKVKELISSILGLLGQDRTTNMAVVGAGNLGRALALHEDFPKHGFVVCGLFDSDPRLLGEEVGHLVVMHPAKLAEIAKEKHVGVGIIAVPSPSAQQAADLIVSSGVPAILNMSAARVRVPRDIPIMHARMYSCLSLLSHAIAFRTRSASPSGASPPLHGAGLHGAVADP